MPTNKQKKARSLREIMAGRIARAKKNPAFMAAAEEGYQGVPGVAAQERMLDAIRQPGYTSSQRSAGATAPYGDPMAHVAAQLGVQDVGDTGLAGYPVGRNSPREVFAGRGVVAHPTMPQVGGSGPATMHEFGMNPRSLRDRLREKVSAQYPDTPGMADFVEGERFGDHGGGSMAIGNEQTREHALEQSRKRRPVYASMEDRSAARQERAKAKADARTQRLSMRHMMKLGMSPQQAFAATTGDQSMRDLMMGGPQYAAGREALAHSREALAAEGTDPVSQAKAAEFQAKADYLKSLIGGDEDNPFAFVEEMIANGMLPPEDIQKAYWDWYKSKLPEGTVPEDVEPPRKGIGGAITGALKPPSREDRFGSGLDFYNQMISGGTPLPPMEVPVPDDAPPSPGRRPFKTPRRPIQLRPGGNRQPSWMAPSRGY